MVKKSTILEHKEKDVTLMRGVLLQIINDEEAPKKEVIEASKLLLRAHHALAPDKTVTATAVAQQAQKNDKLTKDEEAKLKELLSA